MAISRGPNLPSNNSSTMIVRRAELTFPVSRKKPMLVNCQMDGFGFFFSVLLQEGKHL
jgi:hypothetical protein